MNTPSHLIINLAVLRRVEDPHLTWPILVGALIPDAAMFVFYGWAKLIARLPEAQIWSEAFFSPQWQNVFAVGNSIPLAVGGMAIALWLKQPAAIALFISILLHCLEDLPLHHDDAHRHFFPFSDYRFVSPLSYWDPNHHGAIVALLELLLVIGATVYLFPAIQSWWGKGAMLATVGLFTLFYVSFYVLRGS